MWANLTNIKSMELDEIASKIMACMKDSGREIWPMDLAELLTREILQSMRDSLREDLKMERVKYNIEMGE